MDRLRERLMIIHMEWLHDNDDDDDDDDDAAAADDVDDDGDDHDPRDLCVETEKLMLVRIVTVHHW